MAGNKQVVDDAELAANLVLGPIFTNDGIQQLIQIMQQAGQDAPGALAHVLYMHMDQARQAIIQNKLNIDSRAWVAKSGAVDQIINEVCAILASTLGPQFDDINFKSATKRALLQILHDSETAQGGPGNPDMQDDDGEDSDQMPSPEDDEDAEND